MYSRFTRRGLLSGTGGAAAGALIGSTSAHASSSGEREGTWQSEVVHYDAKGRLVYEQDTERNRIPDFSHSGYRKGEKPIPDVSTMLTISPVDGDNTAHIQDAIDEVSGMPLDNSGVRGALLLGSGRYPIGGTLHLRHSGVVLRGVGDDEDPARNTIIHATGDVRDRLVILVGKGDSTGDRFDPPSWADTEPGPSTEILTGWVPVGEQTFTVADPNVLSPGDPVIVVHPCTQGWLDAIEGGAEPPWNVDEYPILYDRYVEAIRGHRVTIDVPVFNHLRRSLSQSYVYRWEKAATVATEVGVENLRVDMEIDEEDRPNFAIRLAQAENAWVRNCTLRNFVMSGVMAHRTTRATVDNCRAIAVEATDPRYRYNFNVVNSQQILFKDCYAVNGRHSYVVNGQSAASGIVFLRGVSARAIQSSEGHRQWSQGILYDNHREVDTIEGTQFSGIRFQNFPGRGDRHGWTAAHSVAWNCDVADKRVVCQKPPTAQNYVIGCFGAEVIGGAFEDGYIEGTNQTGLMPASLYEAQLADRFER